MSRDDAVSGDDSRFDAAIWNSVIANFPNSTISIEQAATARNLRIADAKTKNPQFNLSGIFETNSKLETAFWLAIYGDGINGNANTQFVDTWFRECIE